MTKSDRSLANPHMMSWLSPSAKLLADPDVAANGMTAIEERRPRQERL
jgi:hypothetical protein